MEKEKGIGIELNLPDKKLEELNQELKKHKIKIRGRTVIGKIISKDTHGTAKIQWSRIHPIPKYERFEHRKSGVMAHNPHCLDFQIGDLVKAIECRPISKTKKFVIIEKVK